jgi:hypothetical protein
MYHILYRDRQTCVLQHEEEIPNDHLLSEQEITAKFANATVKVFSSSGDELVVTRRELLTHVIVPWMRDQSSIRGAEILIAHNIAVSPSDLENVNVLRIVRQNYTDSPHYIFDREGLMKAFEEISERMNVEEKKNG